MVIRWQIRIFERILADKMIAAEIIAAFTEFALRAEEEYEKVQEGEAAETP